MSEIAATEAGYDAAAADRIGHLNSFLTAEGEWRPLGWRPEVPSASEITRREALGRELATLDEALADSTRFYHGQLRGLQDWYRGESLRHGSFTHPETVATYQRRLDEYTSVHDTAVARAEAERNRLLGITPVEMPAPVADKVTEAEGQAARQASDADGRSEAPKTVAFARTLDGHEGDQHVNAVPRAEVAESENNWRRWPAKMVARLAFAGLVIVNNLENLRHSGDDVATASTLDRRLIDRAHALAEADRQSVQEVQQLHDRTYAEHQALYQRQKDAIEREYALEREALAQHYLGIVDGLHEQMLRDFTPKEGEPVLDEEAQRALLARYRAQVEAMLDEVVSRVTGINDRYAVFQHMYGDEMMHEAAASHAAARATNHAEFVRALRRYQPLAGRIIDRVLRAVR